MSRDLLIDLSYIAASCLFIIGLKMLGRMQTAIRGNFLSAVGMLVAVVATLLISGLSYTWILVGLLIGSVAGVLLAVKVQMTAMPQMVGLLNGFGGLASMLVAWAEYHGNRSPDTVTAVATILTALVGGVTFSGSMVAFAKLAEWLPGKPILFGGQRLVNASLLLACLVGIVCFSVSPGNSYWAVIAIMLLSQVLGVLAVIPIGGADMPVVICLLNSYSGIAACFAGFIISNNVLIVAGSLVGASGIILTQIMCKAMNRSLANVLFSGFGSATAAAGGAYKGEVNPLSVDDAYYLLEAARNVVIVPGYGMAAAQAQHAVRELALKLEQNGAMVQFCIHPVAGRMPGHMNVLLAEANVPYEQLVEPQDVNPLMSTVDVAIVIGANDVVNPAAKEDTHSPLYGMPIIEVDQARTCIVLKRSMNPGFAGVDNPLFFKANTRMLFGDAKGTVASLVAQFKSA